MLDLGDAISSVLALSSSVAIFNEQYLSFQSEYAQRFIDFMSQLGSKHDFLHSFYDMTLCGF